MLRTIAFIVMMTVGTVAAAFNRFAALLVYLWFALFRPQEWVWIDVSQFRFSLVLGVLLVVPALFSGILPNLTHPLSIGSVLFLAMGLLAQFGAVRPDIGWQWLDFLARLILVCLLLVTMVNTKRRFVLAVAVIAGSFGYHPAKAGLASLIGGGVQFYEGLSGAFADNNGYALGTVMIMPLLLGAAQNLSKSGSFERWVRIAFFASVPLSAFTVVSLFSRGGFLGLAAASLTLVLLQKRRLLAMGGLVLGLAAVLPFVPIQAGYVERMQTIGAYQEVGDESALGRLHFWQVAVEMAKQHPVGVGVWNFQYAYDAHDFSGGRYGTGRSVHSSHFQVLAEMGFPGAILWAGVFALAVRIAWRIRRRASTPGLTDADRHFLFTMSNALVASMAGFVVGGAFVALALNDLTWLTFALLAALDRLSVRVLAGEATETQPVGPPAPAGAAGV
ncbi:MAG: O-antigen ligase family protein [Acidobacteria bacterium]|nr:O-antigen ligase family protein [Acidobacteriota bacterium]